MAADVWRFPLMVRVSLGYGLGGPGQTGGNQQTLCFLLSERKSVSWKVHVDPAESLVPGSNLIFDCIRAYLLIAIHEHYRTANHDMSPIFISQQYNHI